MLAALNLAYSLAERPRRAPPPPAHGRGAAAVDLNALVRRIDQALGADDPLL